MKNQVAGQLVELEDLLVKEFRALQQLADVTREEREVMPGKGFDAITNLAEQKEIILDQLNLMIDKRRQVIQQTSSLLGVVNENSSLKDLLLVIDAENQERLYNLTDAINSLVSEIRDMNYGNIAMANSMVGFIQSVQAMMISSLQKQIDYRPTNKLKAAAAPISTASFDQRV
jgi:flagellar biosynthesis/type III secretory pathway chaperone